MQFLFGCRDHVITHWIFIIMQILSSFWWIGRILRLWLTRPSVRRVLSRGTANEDLPVHTLQIFQSLRNIKTIPFMPRPNLLDLFCCFVHHRRYLREKTNKVEKMLVIAPEKLNREKKKSRWVSQEHGQRQLRGALIPPPQKHLGHRNGIVQIKQGCSELTRIRDDTLDTALHEGFGHNRGELE